MLFRSVSMPDVAPGVFDARLSPDGTQIAFVRGDALCVSGRDGNERVLADESDSGTVSWGSAEFIAAEEMGRHRGYWWSPDGRRIAACRVDVAPVDIWHIADPARPGSPGTTHRYPAAGTANPVARLFRRDWLVRTGMWRCHRSTLLVRQEASAPSRDTVESLSAGS